MRNTSLKPMRAFDVQAREYGVIVFARHAVVARRHGADDLGVDFEDIESVRRAPVFDEYVDAGYVPMRELVENHGWSQECGWCFRRTYNDEVDRRWPTPNQVFCCGECEARFINRDIDLQASEVAIK